MKKLSDTENILKTKNEELEMIRLKLDRNSLMVEGEKEAMKGDVIRYFPLYPQRKFREESAAEIHFRLAGTTSCHACYLIDFREEGPIELFRAE